MCGLAGIFFKKADGNHVLGRALVEMLDGCQHRGPNSTGFALYEDNGSGLRLRFLVEPGDEVAPSRIREALAAQGAMIDAERREGSSFVVEVTFNGKIRPFAYAMEHAAKLVSIGTSLDIINAGKIEITFDHSVDLRISRSNSRFFLHGSRDIEIAGRCEKIPRNIARSSNNYGTSRCTDVFAYFSVEMDRASRRADMIGHCSSYRHHAACDEKIAIDRSFNIDDPARYIGVTINRPIDNDLISGRKIPYLVHFV